MGKKKPADSSSSSSSEDEDFAAFAACAVSFEDITAQQKQIAQKAKERVGRKRPRPTKERSEGAADGEGGNASDDDVVTDVLDPAQIKIAAALDAMLEGQLRVKEPGPKRLRKEAKAAARAEAEEAEAAAGPGGFRFFAAVAPGAPALLEPDDPPPPPGTPFPETFRRRRAPDPGAAAAALPALAAGVQPLVEAAAAAAAAGAAAGGGSGEGGEGSSGKGEGGKGKKGKGKGKEAEVVAALVAFAARLSLLAASLTASSAALFVLSAAVDVGAFLSLTRSAGRLSPLLAAELAYTVLAAAAAAAAHLGTGGPRGTGAGQGGGEGAPQDGVCDGRGGPAGMLLPLVWLIQRPPPWRVSVRVAAGVANTALALLWPHTAPRQPAAKAPAHSVPPADASAVVTVGGQQCTRVAVGAAKPPADALAKPLRSLRPLCIQVDKAGDPLPTGADPEGAPGPEGEGAGGGGEAEDEVAAPTTPTSGCSEGPAASKRRSDGGSRRRRESRKAPAAAPALPPALALYAPPAARTGEAWQLEAHPPAEAGVQGPAVQVVPPIRKVAPVPRVPRPLYRSLVGRRAVRMKVPWAEPEHTAPGFEQRLSDVLASGEVHLGGVWVQPGCVEVTLLLLAVDRRSGEREGEDCPSGSRPLAWEAPVADLGSHECVYRIALEEAPSNEGIALLELAWEDGPHAAPGLTLPLLCTTDGEVAAEVEALVRAWAGEQPQGRAGPSGAASSAPPPCLDALLVDLGAWLAAEARAEAGTGGSGAGADPVMQAAEEALSAFATAAGCPAIARRLSGSPPQPSPEPQDLSPDQPSAPIPVPALRRPLRLPAVVLLLSSAVRSVLAAALWVLRWTFGVSPPPAEEVAAQQAAMEAWALSLMRTLIALEYLSGTARFLRAVKTGEDGLLGLLVISIVGLLPALMVTLSWPLLRRPAWTRLALGSCLARYAAYACGKLLMISWNIPAPNTDGKNALAGGPGLVVFEGIIIPVSTLLPLGTMLLVSLTRAPMVLGWTWNMRACATLAAAAAQALRVEVAALASTLACHVIIRLRTQGQARRAAAQAAAAGAEGPVGSGGAGKGGKADYTL
ncbi:hypothetical protein HYH03_006645 [Edaphochlamys debaryana]|uniref:Uncharacterized protein n=1 Tax=Edaphochlamys debaryana TaxID=47281 RepID=A0A835Y2L9_9CHLO|nr:hypothetical protein HYH03_006645 [Edaphochlamys debaryana]|eukprot:KAG2495377.1 hypothetical protein HYH03_006645 [Edaphochlamys debaryana]